MGLEVVERRLMDLVPAPAVRLMKSRVKSRPGVDSVQLLMGKPIVRKVNIQLTIGPNLMMSAVRLYAASKPN